MIERDTQAPKIRDYALLRVIGRGSYGDVWLARSATGQFRAIKIVFRSRFIDSEPYDREFKGLKAFAEVSLVEARLLALLHVGIDETGEFFFYVMELADDAVAGRLVDPASYVPLTLEGLRRSRTTFSAADVVALGVDLASSLQALHSKGLVHRDVKGSNIIFVGGVPKFADVGLVAIADLRSTYVGTEGFVPPEGPGTTAGDVYSLGKVLYELATGLDRKAYPSLPPNLGDRSDRKDLLEINEVITRACDPDPNKRYPSATELLDDLLLIKAGTSVRKLRKTERQLARLVKLAILLFAATAVAGVGAWAERKRASREMELRLQAEAQRDTLARRSIYAGRLAQVEQSLEAGRFRRARQLLQDALDTQPVDRAPVEWRILHAQARGDAHESWSIPGNGVEKLVPLGRGDILVHARDKRVYLWQRGNLQTLPLTDVHRLTGASPSGDFVYGTDARLKPARWRHDGTKESIDLVGNFRPLGLLRRGLLCFADGDVPRLSLWDPSHAQSSSSAIRPLAIAPGDYFSSALSADAEALALVTIQGRGPAAHWKLSVSRAPHFEPVFTIELPDRPDAIAIEPDGSGVAVAFGASSRVRLLSSSNGSLQAEFPEPVSSVRAMSFSPDGRQLAIAGDDRLLIAAAATLRHEGELRLSGGPVNSLLWDQSAGIYVGCDESRVSLYATDSRPRSPIVDGLWSTPAGGPTFVVSASSSAVIVSLDGDQSQCVDLARGRLGPQLSLSQPVLWRGDMIWGWRRNSEFIGIDLKTSETRMVASLPERVRSHPAGHRASGRWMVGDEKGSVYFGDIESGALTTKTNAHRGAVWWGAMSADGTLALTSGEDRVVVLWDARSGVERRRIQASEAILHGAFSPDGKSVVLARQDGKAEFISLAPDATTTRLIETAAPKLTSALFSQDGQRLVLGGSDAAVYFVDTEGLVPLCAIQADPNAPTGARGDVDLMEWAPGGRLIALLSNGRLATIDVDP